MTRKVRKEEAGDGPNAPERASDDRMPVQEHAEHAPELERLSTPELLARAEDLELAPPEDADRRALIQVLREAGRE